ncbi:MAG TPA: hypothetical protein VEV83_11665 [Parafilimonas sp.]|nr:hypothetical protein [Parafilimonas sp.]
MKGGFDTIATHSIYAQRSRILSLTTTTNSDYMYSKIFQNSDIDSLETEIDVFLKDLEDITGQIINLKMFSHGGQTTVLIVYSCWKKL